MTTYTNRKHRIINFKNIKSKKSRYFNKYRFSNNKSKHTITHKNDTRFNELPTEIIKYISSYINTTTTYLSLCNVNKFNRESLMSNRLYKSLNNRHWSYAVPSLRNIIEYLDCSKIKSSFMNINDDTIYDKVHTIQYRSSNGIFQRFNVKQFPNCTTVNVCEENHPEPICNELYHIIRSNNNIKVQYMTIVARMLLSEEFKRYSANIDKIIIDINDSVDMNNMFNIQYYASKIYKIKLSSNIDLDLSMYKNCKKFSCELYKTKCNYNTLVNYDKCKITGYNEYIIDFIIHNYISLDMNNATFPGVKNLTIRTAKNISSNVWSNIFPNCETLTLEYNQVGCSHMDFSGNDKLKHFIIHNYAGRIALPKLNENCKKLTIINTYTYDQNICLEQCKIDKFNFIDIKSYGKVNIKFNIDYLDRVCINGKSYMETNVGDDKITINTYNHNNKIYI